MVQVYVMAAEVQVQWLLRHCSSLKPNLTRGVPSLRLEDTDKTYSQCSHPKAGRHHSNYTNEKFLLLQIIDTHICHYCRHLFYYQSKYDSRRKNLLEIPDGICPANWVNKGLDAIQMEKMNSIAVESC